MRLKATIAAVSVVLCAGQASAAITVSGVTTTIIYSGQQGEKLAQEQGFVPGGTYAFNFILDADAYQDRKAGYSPSALSINGKSISGVGFADITPQYGQPGNSFFYSDSSGFYGQSAYSTSGRFDFNSPFTETSKPDAVSFNIVYYDRTVASGFTFVTNVAAYTYDVAPRLNISLPEADTWAMMIFGMGLVGAAARRRKPSRQGATA